MANQIFMRVNEMAEELGVIRSLCLQAHPADEQGAGEDRLHHDFRSDRPQVLPREFLRHENQDGPKGGQFMAAF